VARLTIKKIASVGYLYARELLSPPARPPIWVLISSLRVLASWGRAARLPGLQKRPVRLRASGKCACRQAGGTMLHHSARGPRHKWPIPALRELNVLVKWVIGSTERQGTDWGARGAARAVFCLLKRQGTAQGAPKGRQGCQREGTADGTRDIGGARC